MEPVGIPAPQIALKHLRQVVSLYRIWRTKLLDLTSQVAIFRFLLLHPLRPPDNYWSPSGGWVDRCSTLKEQLYRSLENVPAAANTSGQTKENPALVIGCRNKGNATSFTFLGLDKRSQKCFLQWTLSCFLLGLLRISFRIKCMKECAFGLDCI